MKPYSQYLGETRRVLRKLYDRHPESQLIKYESIDYYKMLSADGWVAFTGPRQVQMTNDGLCALSEEME